MRYILCCLFVAWSLVMFPTSAFSESTVDHDLVDISSVATESDSVVVSELDTEILLDSSLVGSSDSDLSNNDYMSLLNDIVELLELIAFVDIVFFSVWMLRSWRTWMTKIGGRR